MQLTLLLTAGFSANVHTVIPTDEIFIFQPHSHNWVLATVCILLAVGQCDANPRNPSVVQTQLKVQMLHSISAHLALLDKQTSDLCVFF
jgi:hypothetical protein